MKQKVLMMCMSMLLLLCFVMFAGCAPASCAKPGNGAAYEFSDAREFSTKAKYRYSKSEPSYWDYYSVEYDITTFEISYENDFEKAAKTQKNIACSDTGYRLCLNTILYMYFDCYRRLRPLVTFSFVSSGKPSPIDPAGSLSYMIPYIFVLSSLF